MDLNKESISISGRVTTIVVEALGIEVPEGHISYGFDYIDVSPSNATRLSGMAKNLRLTSEPTAEFRADKGTFIKPGKFLRALFPDVPPDEMSGMAAKLQRHMAKDDDMFDQLKISNFPSNIYKINHHYSGNLGASCMRHLDSEYFEIYDDSPTTRILYLQKDDKLLARALLHDEVRNIDSGAIFKFMDRVYVCNDNYEEMFFRWAAENGYYRKRYQSYDRLYQVTSPDGSNFEYNMSIPVMSEQYDKVPFLDTFRYYCSCDGILHNDQNHCYEDTLDDTEGNSNDNVITRYEERYSCYHCDDRFHEEDMTYLDGEYVCDDCRVEYYRYCDACNSYHHRDYVNLVSVDGTCEEYYCDGCLENFTFCDGCENHFSDTTNVVGEDCIARDLCEDCIREEDLNTNDWCTTHHVNFSDELSECPLCKKERENELKIKLCYETTMKKIVAKGWTIKNEPGTWMDPYTPSSYFSLVRSGSVLRVFSHELTRTWGDSRVHENKILRRTFYTHNLYSLDGFLKLDRPELLEVG